MKVSFIYKHFFSLVYLFLIISSHFGEFPILFMKISFLIDQKKKLSLKIIMPTLNKNEHVFRIKSQLKWYQFRYFHVRNFQKEILTTYVASIYCLHSMKKTKISRANKFHHS